MSKVVLGAYLIQERQPIAYASRKSAQAKQNYAEINKEFMAILFPMTKFYEHIFGGQVTVHSDHKPLGTIFAKPIGKTPAWLESMLLKL